jgi:hypothetical protein
VTIEQRIAMYIIGGIAVVAFFQAHRLAKRFEQSGMAPPSQDLTA